LTASSGLAHRPGASAPATVAPPTAPELDAALAGVEQAIAAFGASMAGADIAAIETTATELQAAIRAAMPQFAQLARSGALSTPLRHRLALANAQIAAQREALFRAGSGVDQALAILFPPALAQSSVYSASGASSRGPGRVIAAS